MGLETITNYALTYKEEAAQLFGVKRQRELAAMVYMQSCVKEALELAIVDGVNAMHDATEGGFVSALNELAGASKVGLKVIWESIPVLPEVLALKARFGLSDEQVLAMSSTGTILGAVKPEAQVAVKEKLGELGLSGVFIGEFMETGERVLVKGKKETAFPSTADDPYTLLLAATS